MMMLKKTPRESRSPTVPSNQAIKQNHENLESKSFLWCHLIFSYLWLSILSVYEQSAYKVEIM